MAVITPFFDVVAGVAILVGRSSLLDTGIFKTANTNFTIRHLLALGFIGYGGWNLWKIERAQDKLKKTLDAESFGAEDNAPYAGVFEKMEVTFKIQDADYATFYYTTEIPSGLRRHSDEHIVSYIWGDEYELQDDDWFYLPYDWNGVGEHYLAKVMNKTLKAESFEAEGKVSDYEKLEYIHSTLQECGEYPHDEMVETSLGFVEDLREPYFNAESDRDDTEYLEAMQGIITNFEDSFCPSCSWGLDKHTIVNFNGMPFAYCEMGDNPYMNAESFGAEKNIMGDVLELPFDAESMLVKSDDLMVELMGFDGSYRSDGEVKVGYTTAAELGYEPKQLKPVMWVWDDIEGYGAFMATEDIRFV